MTERVYHTCEGLSSRPQKRKTPTPLGDRWRKMSTNWSTLRRLLFLPCLQLNDLLVLGRARSPPQASTFYHSPTPLSSHSSAPLQTDGRIEMTMLGRHSHGWLRGTRAIRAPDQWTHPGRAFSSDTPSRHSQRLALPCAHRLRSARRLTRPPDRATIQLYAPIVESGAYGDKYMSLDVGPSLAESR